MKAFGGTADAARAIVGRYHADYVLICPGVGESTIYARRAPKGFYSELAAGRAPDWLEPMPLAGDTPYRLWKRSEEHTSELQSLMRISYAVFCLKKKKQEHIKYTHTHQKQIP